MTIRMIFGGEPQGELLGLIDVLLLNVYEFVITRNHFF
jgi:hypothetical protein